VALLVFVGVVVGGPLGTAGGAAWSTEVAGAFALTPTGAHLAGEFPAHVGVSIVTGVLTLFGPRGGPVAGVPVFAAGQGCTGVPGPATCPVVGSTVTNSIGFFEFSLGNGSYFVYSANTTAVGGTWQPITVSGADQFVSLLAYPRVTYDQSVEVLPAWNPMSAYAANCNLALPCRNGTYGTQVPILAWTQDGAFYVNASLELVFYSFANGSVTPIAPWSPLFQNVMWYEGVENTEWATADGSFIYTFGCPTLCDPNASIAFYAVNVTTGATFSATFEGIQDRALRVNGQFDLIGRDGNHSIAALILANGTVIGYNLWNETQWQLGTFPFFEANNAYWVPNLNSYIDVEAEGAITDRIDQYELTGEGAGGALTLAFAGTYGHGYISNGVDGLYLNLTSHTVVLTEAYATGNLTTQVYGWDAAGTLFGPTKVYAGYHLGAWPQAGATPNAYASEHRPSLVAGGPMLMGYWNGFFANQSWLYEPNLNSYYSTNLAMSPVAWTNPTYRQSALSPAAVENLFFNTTYEIVESSVNCRTPGSVCPLNGTDGASVPGTVWWTWRVGAAPFPYPATAALAQPTAPGAVTVGVRALSNSAVLSWSAPTTGQNPILNYTAFWRPLGEAHWSSAALAGSAHGLSLTGLTPNTTFEYAVWAWNLHWHGSGGNGSFTTAPRPHLIDGFGSDPGEVSRGTAFLLTVALAPNVSGAPLSYQGLPGDCLGGTGPTVICQSDLAGVYNISVTVTDALGQADVAATIVRVDLGLSPVRIEGPIALDAGQLGGYHVDSNGTGIAPLTVAWRADFGWRANATIATVAFPTSGLHLLLATVTDAEGVARSSSELIEVGSTLALGLSVDGPAAVVGVPITIRADPNGHGTAPYVFAFTPSVAEAGTDAETIEFDVPGTYTVGATVTDAAGSQAVATLALHVLPAPFEVRFPSAVLGTDVGRTVPLLVAIVGGSGATSVTLAGGPPGCTLVSACRPTVPGEFNLVATARDASGLVANASAILLVHEAPLAAAVVVAAGGAPVVGSPITWLVGVTGGTPPIALHFESLPAGCTVDEVQGPAIACVPTTAGTFPVTLVAVDAAGAAAVINSTVVVHEPTLVWSGLARSGGSSLDTLPGWIVAGGVIAASILATVVVRRERRLRPPPRIRRGRPPQPGRRASPGRGPPPGGRSRQSRRAATSRRTSDGPWAMPPLRTSRQRRS